MGRRIEIRNTKVIWADYVEQDLAEPPEDRRKRKAEVCAKCRYSNKVSGHVTNSSADYIICCYILDTGHMRGCSAIDCMRFEPKKKEVKTRWAD